MVSQCVITWSCTFWSIFRLRSDVNRCVKRWYYDPKQTKGVLTLWSCAMTGFLVKSCLVHYGTLLRRSHPNRTIRRWCASPVVPQANITIEKHEQVSNQLMSVDKYICWRSAGALWYFTLTLHMYSINRLCFASNIIFKGCYFIPI